MLLALSKRRLYHHLEQFLIIFWQEQLTNVWDVYENIKKKFILNLDLKKLGISWRFLRAWFTHFKFNVFLFPIGLIFSPHRELPR